MLENSEIIAVLLPSFEAVDASYNPTATRVESNEDRACA